MCNIKSKATYLVKYQEMTLCKATSRIDAKDIAAAMNAKFKTNDYYVVVSVTVTKEEEVH